MKDRLKITWLDDENMTIQVDGKNIATLNHDEDGSHGMTTAERLAEALVAALAKSPPGPLHWDRLEPPPRRVRRVRLPSGIIAKRADPTGQRWSLPGWVVDIAWSQLLAWGPLEEVHGRG